MIWHIARTNVHRTNWKRTHQINIKSIGVRNNCVRSYACFNRIEINLFKLIKHEWIGHNKYHAVRPHILLACQCFKSQNWLFIEVFVLTVDTSREISIHDTFNIRIYASWLFNTIIMVDDDRRVAAYTRVRSWIHIILTKKIVLVTKMWFEIQPRSSDLIITTLYKSYSLNRTPYRSICFEKLSAFAALQSRKFARAVFSKCKQMFTAIHLHFYAKINGFSLVKKALRRPQNAPNCTIYFKIFRGACPLTP